MLEIVESDEDFIELMLDSLGGWEAMLEVIQTQADKHFLHVIADRIRDGVQEEFHSTDAILAF